MWLVEIFRRRCRDNTEGDAMVNFKHLKGNYSQNRKTGEAARKRRPDPKEENSWFEFCSCSSAFPKIKMISSLAQPPCSPAGTRSRAQETAPPWGSEAQVADDCLWDLKYISSHASCLSCFAHEVGEGVTGYTAQYLKLLCCSQTVQVQIAESDRLEALA